MKFLLKENNLKRKKPRPLLPAATKPQLRRTFVRQVQLSQTDAKPTAEQESGSSDPLVEGGGNQGTEKQ
jgi:hypothetical protein